MDKLLHQFRMHEMLCDKPPTLVSVLVFVRPLRFLSSFNVQVIDSFQVHRASMSANLAAQHDPFCNTNVGCSSNHYVITLKGIPTRVIPL